MPQTIELEVKAWELHKGDRINTARVDRGDVITGKMALSGVLVVSTLERRTKNVVVNLTNGAAVTLRMEADVAVKRVVPTEEEKEADRVAFMEKRIRSQMNGGLFGVGAAKNAMVEYLARDWVDPDQVNNLAQSIGEAQVVERFWLEVLEAALQDNQPMTLEEALAYVRERTTRSIFSSGPDDTWSGRGNDMRRAMFDAKRKLCDDRWI